MSDVIAAGTVQAIGPADPPPGSDFAGDVNRWAYIDDGTFVDGAESLLNEQGDLDTLRTSVREAQERIRRGEVRSMPYVEFPEGLSGRREYVERIPEQRDGQWRLRERTMSGEEARERGNEQARRGEGVPRDGPSRSR